MPWDTKDWALGCIEKDHPDYGLLKVDFGSGSYSRVLDFYSNFIKKSTLLDFNSGKSDRDLTPPRRTTLIPSPNPDQQFNFSKPFTRKKRDRHRLIFGDSTFGWPAKSVFCLNCGYFGSERTRRKEGQSINLWLVHVCWWGREGVDKWGYWVLLHCSDDSG